MIVSMAKSDHTPIDINSIENSYNQIRVKTLTKSHFKVKIDRSSLILILSIIFFLAGISFWGYVNYYAKI